MLASVFFFLQLFRIVSYTAVLHSENKPSLQGQLADFCTTSTGKSVGLQSMTAGTGR